MTTKLICLIGASGSEKKMVAKELENRGYNVIQSYTTRPPRYENEWGHTFLDSNKWWGVEVKGTFVGIENDGDADLTDKGVSNLWGINDYVYIDKDDMIAYFNSYNSGHHYFATDEQVIRNMANIYVVDPKGAEMVHDYYRGTDIEVITIYLQVDWIERRGRLMGRGDTYKETMDRLKKDDKLFQIVKCDYVVDGNSNLSYILTNIEQIIEVEND